MRKQNSIKRTVISLSLAFSLSAIAWSIQNHQKNDEIKKARLEASVYPKVNQVFQP